MKGYTFDELREFVNKAVEKEYARTGLLCGDEIVQTISSAEKRMEALRNCL